ncbi:MAG: DUF4166 domain-containing protein [Ahniella sp.]|nr:DUF4166 domain-containing protein [Ahniella sp.]
MASRLFPLLLGPGFESLPEACRAMHGFDNPSSAKGHADITRGSNFLARFMGAMARMPQAGKKVPLEVRFEPASPGIETWERNFDGSRFRSRLTIDQGLLREVLFPLHLWFRLVASADGVHWVFHRAKVLGLIPLPGALAPRIEAREWSVDGRYHFLASVGMPLIGLIVRYEGSLDAPKAL